MEDSKDEEKLLRHEIADNKKTINELEAKLRQQQSMFEEIRSERNSFKKNLSFAQDEINQLKNKFKDAIFEIDKLKEQLASKEEALLKQEFCESLKHFFYKVRF